MALNRKTMNEIPIKDYLTWLADNPDQDPFPAKVQIADDGTQTISDGYHTFEELYEMRMLLNAHLFNEWESAGKCTLFKSIYHIDNNNEVVPCFGSGWFLVVAKFPTIDKQISFHYETKYWELFKIPAVGQSWIADHYKYDGHTSKDIAEILTELL